MMRRSIPIASIIVVVLVVIGTTTLLSQPLGWLTRYVIVPIHLRLDGVLVHDLEAENARLRRIVRTVIGTHETESTLVSWAEERAAVRAWAQGRGVPLLIVATSIMRVPHGGEQLLLIDSGSAQGIAVDDTVIMTDGVVVGRVAVIGDRVALVRMVTEPGSRFAAMVSTTTAPLGLVEGEGHTATLALRFIAREEDIRAGDSVLTSGLDSGVPPRLLIGIVDEVVTPESVPWKQIRVQPMVRPADIRTVGVITRHALSVESY